jgi:hypothetical protein
MNRQINGREEGCPVHLAGIFTGSQCDRLDIDDVSGFGDFGS